MKPLQFQIVEELVGEDAPPLALDNDYIASDGVGGSGSTPLTFKRDRETKILFMRALLHGLLPLPEAKPKEEKPEEPKKEASEEDKPDLEAEENPETIEEKDGEEPSEVIEEPVEEPKEVIAPEEPEEEVSQEDKMLQPLADDPELLDYFVRIVDEIFAAEKGTEVISRSNAFVASRVVVLRYAFALRHDLKTKARYTEPRPANFFSPERLEEISDFIADGFKAVIECLRSCGEAPQPDAAMLQFYLPATLASASISQKEDGTYHIDVLSAGDSRVYLYSGSGLRQVSRDDEDEAGMMDNYFRLIPGKKTRINHRMFNLNSPFVVFVCSDGCFDPFSFSEGMGTASMLFGEEKKAPASLEEWAKEVIGRYLSNHLQGDDISIALGAYGFKDMQAIFDLYFKKHAEIYGEYTKKALQFASYLDVIRKGETPEKDTYIESRIPAIYAMRLVPFLLQCVRGEAEDYVYTKELDAFIRDGVPTTRPYTEAEAKTVATEALKIAILCNDPHFAIKDSGAGKPIVELHEKLYQIAAKIRTGRGSTEEFLRCYDELARAIEDLPELGKAFDKDVIRKLDNSDGFVEFTPEEMDRFYKDFLLANSAKISKMIIEELEAHPDQPSKLDAWFNAGLLEKCRLNLLLRKGIFPKEVIELSPLLIEQEAKITKLIADKK